MNIPRYWARANSGTVSCWRSSDASQADADERARTAVAELAERHARGEVLERRYCYADRPLKECILERIGGDERGAAILSRNAYGAVILNTADVMFIDVDFPVTPPSPGRGLLGRLFGGRAAPPDDSSDRLHELVDLVRTWAGGPDGGCARLYETAAGARVLLTDGFYAPASADTAAIMTAFGADPKYQQLCRVQESFRARLTPKPWRCGVEPMSVSWPFRDDADEHAAARWQERYDRHRDRFAVCALVEASEPRPAPEAVQRTVALHDRWTGASSGLPLA